MRRGSSFYMEKHIKSCKCGSIEFVSKPNRYDIYQIINGKLELSESPFMPDEIKLFCRECSEELLGADEFVTA